jgi:hypothetical protein
MFWNKWGECVLGWENMSHKQIKDSWSPFMMGVHYIANRANMVIQSMGNLTLITQIRMFTMNMCGYFNHPPKRHLEF